MGNEVLDSSGLDMGGIVVTDVVRNASECTPSPLGHLQLHFGPFADVHQGGR